jgi:indolepyruvate ferredoxin oxidoreductase alpha subunit
MEKILKHKGKSILLGNEAIVRGALEAGAQFITTYPGTPATEIGDIFNNIKCQMSPYHCLRRATGQANVKCQFYFEYSVNEKVALEAGIGASLAGLKILVAMKDFGINVCLDALGPFCYTGSNGATVFIVADDPSCHSSAQWEENTRGISRLVHIPTLEPSDPQECKDFTKIAFKISEKFKIPVMLRITTRVAHQRGIVNLGKIPKDNGQGTNKFQKDPKKWSTMPPRVLEMKKELLEKIKKIQDFSETSPINQVCGDPLSANFSTFHAGTKTSPSPPEEKTGIICSGISYLYTQEALKGLNLEIPILKLGFFYPLPEQKIKNFIKPLKRVLIIEELEPYLENEIEKLAKNVNPELKIFGENLLPRVGEFKPEFIISAISKITNTKLEIGNSLQTRNWKLEIPRRTPRLCPDCPYWFVFAAIKKALQSSGSGQANSEIIFGGDIGCYMLFGSPSINMQDYLFCMGSSISIAHGIKKATTKLLSRGETNGHQKLISFIGDATFFHAGIPGLINAVHNQSEHLIIIMDNQTTAMTGHQPHPGLKSDHLPTIKIENIVKACGVKNLKILDPAKDSKELIKTIKEFLKKKEVSVIVSRKPCARIKP